MTNKLFTGLLIVNFLGMSFLIFLHFSANQKVGYIDSSKVVNAYHGMVEARKDYQAKAAIWQANIDTLASEVQKEIFKFENESARMTAREKDLTRKLIETKQQQLANYQRAIKEKAGQEDAAGFSDQRIYWLLRNLNPPQSRTN